MRHNNSEFVYCRGNSVCLIFPRGPARFTFRGLQSNYNVGKMDKKKYDKKENEEDMGENLSYWQQRYRIMEGDRAVYSGEVSGKLQRQQKLIRILQTEQNNLLTDLKVATSSAKRREDDCINEQLDALLREHEQLENSVKTEKAHLNELDYQIKKVEKEVADIKTKTITDKQSQQRIIRGQKMLAMSENRLEVAVKKFNVVVAENFELRKEIDHLLKERAHFNLLWETLVNNLNQGKKFMLDLIEQATLAYDQREEWCNKLQALRARGHQDLVAHTQEMRELQRRLDHDSKLQQFLGVKGQKRVLADLEAREARKRQQLKESMERQLELYRDTLRQIQEFCGESDLERLAAKFVKQEEENFALFNYVNELNHESESLSYAIEDLKRHIDEQRELNSRRERQQQDNLEALAARLRDKAAEADEAEGRLRKFDGDLAAVLKGIENIFRLLKCNNAPILELLGDNANINPYNVLMYIGLVEKRASELMQQVYFREKLSLEKVKRGKAPAGTIRPDPRSRYKHNPLESLVPTQPCPLCVEQEQVSDVIDTLQIAQKEDEVVDRLSERLALPNALDRLHNVSACHLPQSRRIIQQRYQ